jgi:phage FluMu gp28-like protein
MAFEQKRTRIPISRTVREDLHSMQRVTSNSGTVTYRAPHNDDGHADRCTAKALSQRAASYSNGPFKWERIAIKGREQRMTSRQKGVLV